MQRVRGNWIRLSRLRIFSDDIGMVFGLGKCAVLGGKMVWTEGIELPDGKCMREVMRLQLDSIMNGEMKEKVKSKYIRRVKKLLMSQLNGGNIIAGITAWVVGIIRCGAGLLDMETGQKKNWKVLTLKLES